MDKEKRIAEDLKKCADILHGLAELLEEDAAPSAAGKKPEAAAAKKSNAPAKAAAPITLEAVRAVAARLAGAGAAEQVKALIEQHGAAKLSAVPKEAYPALLQELEGISLDA